MLNMTQDVGAGSCQLLEIRKQLQNLVKSWSQMSRDPTNDVKSTSKYPGDSSSDSLWRFVKVEDLNKFRFMEKTREDFTRISCQTDTHFVN